MEACKRKHQGETFSVREKLMVYNCFTYFANSMSVSKAVEETAKALDCGKGIVYSIRKEKENCPPASVAKTKCATPKNTRLHIYDEHVQMLVRRKVHSFFLRNIPPTLDMILGAVGMEETIPNFSRSTLYRLLKDIGFSFEKIGKKVMMMDRDDIIRWRHTYLRNIRRYRSEGRNIVFTDESWVNVGHFVSKAWTDTTVSTSRNAFINDLSTGLTPPKGRGQRYALIHAGNEKGFVTGAEYNFLCKKNTLDAHDEVCAELYESWFLERLLPNLPANSVIVIDNASYHSRKQEKIPTTASKKQEIFNWLSEKGIPLEEGLLKRDLLQILSIHKDHYNKYLLDETAAQMGHTILRLPPYHCTLNPIEMVWAQVKNYIKHNNTSFKTKEIPILIEEGYKNVSVQNWQNYIKHVMNGMATFFSYFYLFLIFLNF